MAYQDINTGTPGNRDGDKLRNAFVKVKDMFIELYSLIKTNTSQLVNDGENGIDPFITLNDIPAQSGGELEKITEGGNTGYRLKGVDSINYGNIGQNAVDLSRSTSPSTVNGATGISSFTNGTFTIASGVWSTATGVNTIASGLGSHAQNNTNTASGINSHAEGQNTIASGDSSHSQGISTFARSHAEHSGGLYGTDYIPLNTSGRASTDRLVNYGNGTGTASPSDAFTIYKNGAIQLHPVSEASIFNAGAGFMIIDSADSNKLKFHDGTAWRIVSFV